MRDVVKKMLFKALKNDDLAEVVKNEFVLFGLHPILNLNRDWDWNYEGSKVKMIHDMVDARKEYSIKSIKKEYKRILKETPYLWYDEFRDRAKSILKNWRTLKCKYPKKN